MACTIYYLFFSFFISLWGLGCEEDLTMAFWQAQDLMFNQTGLELRELRLPLSPEWLNSWPSPPCLLCAFLRIVMSFSQLFF